MAKQQKVYMPLVIGDWLKGTRGMKAEIRGVYINLLLYQWDNGYIPSDMEELFLIDPEVGKVWDKIKHKFLPAGPGKLQNEKCEEVREFWKKQSKNGKKGGRPKKENPDHNPNPNPNDNPKHNHHNDLDIDNDLEEKLEGAFDEIYLDQEKIKWPHIDFMFEFRAFVNKVRGSPGKYKNHDSGGLRLALQSQLRNAKPINGTSKTKQQRNTESLIAGFNARHGPDAPSG